MANKRNTLSKKEKCLDELLKEGEKYICIMQNMHKWYECDSNLYNSVLFLMDRYSRYKTQVKEDMEELKEMFEEMQEMAQEMADEEEEAIEEDDMEEADVIPEGHEDDVVELDEEEICIQEQVRYFQNIIFRKTTLANLETILVRLLNVDARLMCTQWTVYLRLKIFMQHYCKRAKEVLERNRNFIQSLKHSKERQLAETIQSKYGKLQRLLMELIEKQQFFANIEVQ